MLIVILGRGDHLRDADRHLPRHRHPGHRRHLELRRPAARGDGEAHRHQLRARPHHHRQRHRAHREPVAQRHRRHQDLSSSPAPRSRPPSRRSPPSPRPCSGSMPPGTTPPLIIQYSASNVPILQLGARAATRCSEQQLFDYWRSTSSASRWPPCRARRSPSPTAASSGRSWSISIPTRLYALGLSPADVSQRDRRAEPDPPRRHGQDRRQRIPRPAQQQPRRRRPSSTTCRSRRQRHHRLHPRRRPRARRLFAADQHRARRRARTACCCRSSSRRRLHAGRRRARRDGAAAASWPRCPKELQAHARCSISRSSCAPPSRAWSRRRPSPPG